jgi:hypothetical protein
MVTATVESMAGDLARGGRNGRHPAEVGERGLAAQPVRIVARRDEQVAAVMVLMPLTASSSGAVAATKGSSCWSRNWISAVRC